MNLFEDGLRETLETTRLPCNVSKINDCMKKLDPTYRLDETGFPSFSTMCQWFDDIGGLIEMSKHRDSVMLVGSKLERDVVKRIRTPRPPSRRSGRRRGRRLSPSRRGRRSASPMRGGNRGGRSRSPRSRSPERRSRSAERGRGADDDGADDRWPMA